MSAYPLYDSNFQLYRLSPLYNGSSPVLDNLNLYCRKLRAALNGDSSLSLAGFAANEFGSLKSCVWELLGDESQWQSAHQEQAEEDEISAVGEVSARDARGIYIELEYDKAKQTALMVGEPKQKTSLAGFTNLPLLLVSMPVPLREILFKYLTTTFDCRLSPMKLRSAFLSSSLERILDRDATDVANLQEQTAKSLQLQLSFPSVAPSLKNIDIWITKDDLVAFLSHGKKMREEQNIPTEQSGAVTGAFTSSLSTYFQQHTALRLDHPGVVLSRFVYGEFAVSGDGKVKVLQSSRTAKDFWNQVIKEASSGEFEGYATGNTHDKTLQENTNFQSTSRESPEDQLPSEPPPPYELYDPATKIRARTARR